MKDRSCTLSLGRFRNDYTFFSHAIDIADDVQVLVQLNGLAQWTISFSKQAHRSGVAHILEINDVAFLRCAKRFRLHYGILRPSQERSSYVRLLRRQSRRRFFRLVSNFQVPSWINFRSE